MSLWNKYHENLLKKWSSMAKTYSLMHSSSSQYYSKWDKRLSVPVILLGAITASSIFTAGTGASNEWIYINGGMALLMTGLSGISKFLGTHEKQVKHTSAAFKYTQISMNIDTVLSFPRDQREEKPRQFINDIKLIILEVREHSPNLPTWIINYYIRKMDKTITNTKTRVNRRRTSVSKRRASALTALKGLDDIDYHKQSGSSSYSGPDSKKSDLIDTKSIRSNSKKSQDGKNQSNNTETMTQYENSEPHPSDVVNIHMQTYEKPVTQYTPPRRSSMVSVRKLSDKHTLPTPPQSTSINNYRSIDMPDFNDDQTDALCKLSIRLERDMSDFDDSSESEPE